MPVNGEAYASKDQIQDSHSESNMHEVGEAAAAQAVKLRSMGLANANSNGRPFGK